jgi:hypothetical protein
MRLQICLSAAVALLLMASQSLAQTPIPNPITFEDLTDNGFGLKFSNDASANFTISNIGGSNRMLVPRTGAFQEADTSTGNPASGFYQAMQAALNNPSGYDLSYDYYIDTASFTQGGTTAGNFYQLGTYVNVGSGAYAQDFPGSGKELELNGSQLASGQLFQGTVTVNFAAAGLTVPSPATETFFRLGFIENGDGTGQHVYFDNINIFPVPEPATFGLIAMGLAGFFAVQRRLRKAA